MTKELLTNLLVVIGLTILCFGVHGSMETPELPFTLQKLYLFYGIFTINLVLMAVMLGQHMKEYIGFLFLGLILIKMIFLYITFPEVLRTEEAQPKPVLLHFMVPYFVFLVTEVLLVVNIIRKKDFKKKDETLEKIK
jgi:hypothetical protein